jgi:hypothetical protein
VDLFWARIVDPFAIAGSGVAATGGAQPAILFPGNSAAATQSTNTQDIYGAYVTLKPVKNWTIEPYFFTLQDHRSLGTAAAPTTVLLAQAPGQSRNFLGGRVNGKQGGLDFTYEGNYQFGSISSNCTRLQTTAACGFFAGTGTSAAGTGAGQDARINAHQHAVKTGFTFDAVPMKPRLGFEFNYASGDKCANGGATGPGQANGCEQGKSHFNTADNLYPTNHFHYGYMDMMAWKNMVNYQVMFDVKPSPVSKLQFNYIIHRLANTADNWYRAGQVAFATSRVTNQEASLGQELDVHYWHTFKEKFKFEIGYGHFFAGAYIDKTASSSTNVTQGASAVQATAIVGTTQSSTLDQNWGYVMGSILF